MQRYECTVELRVPYNVKALNVIDAEEIIKDMAFEDYPEAEIKIINITEVE